MARKKQARLNHSNNPLSPTETVLNSFEQVSKSTTNLAEKSTSQQVNKSTSQAEALNLRKATFKIDSDILDSLDRYHLQLQLDLGKRNTPFKETIVELALQKILEKAKSNPEQLLKLLNQRQQLRM